MKKAKRSRTKAQHAPTSGRASLVRQASRSLPLHTASTSRNFTSGGTMNANATTISTVSTPLARLENRLARIHPTTPVVLAGGSAEAGGLVRTNASAVLL